MGFCIFNNVAIGAAEAARRTWACSGWRWSISMSITARHQHMFAADPGLFYASTHQMPLYPGTGVEQMNAASAHLQRAVAPYAGSAEFRRAMEDIVLPALRPSGPNC